LRVIHAAKELQPGGRKVCLAIGFFDGVHLGHQQVIRQTLTDARQREAIALVLSGRYRIEGRRVIRTL